MSNGIFPRIFTGDINRFRQNCLDIARERGYAQDNPVSFPILASTASNSYSRVAERTVIVSHVEPAFKTPNMVWIPMDSNHTHFGKVVQYGDDASTLGVVNDSTAIWNDYTFGDPRPA